MEITLREIKLNDLEQYLYWNSPSRKFHKFNWPYFKQRTQNELINHVNLLKDKLLDNQINVLENKELIINEKNELIWEVNWYWKSKETLWLEVWIVIFNEKFWWKWIWYIALKKWINKIFKKHPKIIRIGLTTWSWNIAMMKLAEKLWLEREAVFKKARIVNGEYFDSISYWILKEKWKNK